MSFYKKLTENQNNIETIYDLGVYCYKYLAETITVHNIFMGDYIYEKDNKSAAESEEYKSNGNLVNLKLFSDQVKAYLTDAKQFDPWNDGEKIKHIIEMAEKMEAGLLAYGDVDLNIATVPFFLLYGIDLFLRDDSKSLSTEIRIEEPLNKNFREVCSLFLRTKTLMDEIIEEKDYPEVVESNDFRHFFKGIIIVRRDELPQECEQLKIVTLQKNPEIYQAIVERRELKIAVVPMSCETPVKFIHIKGASFRVKYEKSQMLSWKEKVIESLEIAINRKVNVIAFPEYVCSEEIQEAISSRLREIYIADPERLNELLFVAAGSYWASDDNNVSRLYSFNGDELGNVYKYSAYDNIKDGKKYVERLTIPGKEITMVRLPGIGLIQIAICRDISEATLSARMARIFSPQILLVLAWSSSLNIAFTKQLEEIIGQNHTTCAVVCNCCAAFEEEKRETGQSGTKLKWRKDIGMMVAPQKKGSVIGAKKQNISRKKAQCSQCGHCKCVFICNLDFAISYTQGQCDVKQSFCSHYC